MFTQPRHQAIIDAVKARSPLSVPDLEKLLGASPATVRRDLAFLEGLGKIVRTHGGVMDPSQVDAELSFDRKSRAALGAKVSVAELALELVAAGSTVFVDAGTTAFELGRRLVAREQLTVFTNSIPLLSEKTGPGTRLVALGGEVRAVSLALVGAGALDWIARLRVDIAFLAASGIDAASGPTTTELSEAEIKRLLVQKAKRVVLLADASKWGQPTAIRYADWAQIHDFYTDHELTRAERAVLARAGTQFHPVKK